MAEDKRTMTAPLAIIKSNGKAIGKMKNITITETYRRGRVQGLGELTASEVPPLEFNGVMNCEFFMINLKKTGVPGALNREVPSLETFINNVLLQEEGIDVTIFKKVKDTVDANGMIVPELQEFATISSGFIDRQSFNIADGNITGTNQDFTYLNPILFIP